MACGNPNPGGGVWFIDSVNQVTIDKLAYQVDGSFVNNATIAGQMEESDGTPIGSPVTFTYQISSNGKYVGVLPTSLDLQEGATYNLVITITTGQGVHTQRLRRLATFDDR